MRFNKTIPVLVLLALLLVSCNKAHFGNLQGVEVEGEALLPLASSSITMMDMMQRFEIDDLLSFDASGNMSYNMNYEHNGAILMSDYLKFKSLSFEEHIEFINPHIQGLIQPIDTTVQFEQTMAFDADYVSVVEAVLRSGRFDFEVESNIGAVQQVVIRSTDIKDAEGNDLEVAIPYNPNSFGFNLDGLRYQTDTPNSMNFSFELHFTMMESADENLYLDFRATGSEVKIKEMTGSVMCFGTHNSVDTAFDLFPGRISGVLNLNDIRIGLRERNTLNMAARLQIDTFMISSEGVSPYSLVNPLPLQIDFPVQSNFTEVFNKTVDGTINASGGEIYAAADFLINPNGSTELFTVYDTSRVDILVDVEIPMAFRVDEVHFMDTINMNIGQIEALELIKGMVLEFEFVSSIPFDLGGKFMMYDSKTNQITDVLLDDAMLISSSYDGQASQSSAIIILTEEQLQHVLNSDKIILDLQLDTDGHDVVLNANQALQFFTKAMVEYDGIVKPEN